MATDFADNHMQIQVNSVPNCHSLSITMYLSLCYVHSCKESDYSTLHEQAFQIQHITIFTILAISIYLLQLTSMW